MSMTEEESRKKICPFAISGSWIIRHHNGSQACCCGASDCMAWEWSFRSGRYVLCEPREARTAPERPQNITDSWEFVPYDSYNLVSARWEQPAEENRDNWTGYCHLIFRPCGGAE